MKFISIIFCLVAFNVFQTQGQTQNSAPASTPVQPENQVTEIPADSTQKAPQAVIQSNVNKDGVIEISRKEFDKIPPARQELMKNNKNHKIVEDK
jgi:hypothetical protein